MTFFTNTWQRIWESIVDNRNKLTATGGFLLGIIVTLGFKDFYPDLELAFSRRKRTLRYVPRSHSGQADYLRLEDHTGRKSLAGSKGNEAGHLENEDIRLGVEGLIGNTPLIKLKSLSEATGCEILAKAELLNGAGNSPKDRVALSMIICAEEAGLLQPGRGDTVYEGTVGSTGISLAAVCRARGYKAHMYVKSLTSIVILITF
jgi:cysteine synthase A